MGPTMLALLLAAPPNTPLPDVGDEPDADAKVEPAHEPEPDPDDASHAGFFGSELAPTETTEPASVTHSGTCASLARTMAMTTAKMAQAVTSSMAAQAMVTAPTRVRSRFCSVRMRASTGKAVTLMAAPRNSEKPVKPTLASESRG